MESGLLRPGVCTAVATALFASGGGDGSASRAKATSQSPTSLRPNILVIMVDDLRPDLGAYGNRTAHPPNMDGLARSGIVFDHAYTQQALCAPSRATLLTGLRPNTTGVTALDKPVSKAVPDAVTLPQLFVARATPR